MTRLFPKKMGSAWAALRGVAPSLGLALLLAGPVPAAEAPQPAEAESSPTATEVPATIPAPTPAASAPAGPNAFEMIWKRNIFDQSRSPRAARREDRPAARKAPVVESFALVGTMSFSGGLIAFFNSEQSDFRKSAKQGETVGDFKVLDVAHSSVRLRREAEEFTLEIGRQIKREDGGPWEVSKEAVVISGPARAPEKPAEASSGGGVSDLLRRLREKREKEMKP